VIDALGIICEVSWHPSGVGVTSASLGESWSRLQQKLVIKQENLLTHTPEIPTLKEKSIATMLNQNHYYETILGYLYPIKQTHL